MPHLFQETQILPGPGQSMLNINHEQPQNLVGMVEGKQYTGMDGILAHEAGQGRMGFHSTGFHGQPGNQLAVGITKQGTKLFPLQTTPGEIHGRDLPQAIGDLNARCCGASSAECHAAVGKTMGQARKDVLGQGIRGSPLGDLTGDLSQKGQPGILTRPEMASGKMTEF